jgi:hypothetical protein
MEEMLIENCANGPFYVSPSQQIVERQNMRANAREQIGKELKMKRKT